MKRASLFVWAVASVGVLCGGVPADAEPDGEDREVNITAIPEAARGFAGMVRGTLVERTAEDRFVLEVGNVLKTWADNEAEDAESLVGTTLTAVIAPEGRRGPGLIEALAEMEPGDTVDVELFDQGGEVLTVRETLKTAEPEGGGEDRCRKMRLLIEALIEEKMELRSEIVELQARIAELEPPSAEEDAEAGSAEEEAEAALAKEQARAAEQRARYEAEVANLKAQLAAMKAEHEQIAAMMAQARKQSAELQRLAAKQQAETAKLRARTRELQTQNVDLKQRIRKLESENAELRARLAEE